MSYTQKELSNILLGIIYKLYLTTTLSILVNKLKEHIKRHELPTHLAYKYN